MTDKEEEKEFKVTFHRMQLLRAVAQAFDGAILQGERVLDACESDNEIGQLYEYSFHKFKFELWLYLQSLKSAVDHVRRFSNHFDNKRRLDERQEISELYSLAEVLISKIDYGQLQDIRNAWSHIEDGMVGELRGFNLDPIDDGITYKLAIQIADEEIILCDLQYVGINSEGQTVKGDFLHISVQGSLSVLKEVRKELSEVLQLYELRDIGL